MAARFLPFKDINVFAKNGKIYCTEVEPTFEYDPETKKQKERTGTKYSLLMARNKMKEISVKTDEIDPEITQEMLDSLSDDEYFEVDVIGFEANVFSPKDSANITWYFKAVAVKPKNQNKLPSTVHTKQ